MLKVLLFFLFVNSVDLQTIDMVAIESVVESNTKSLISDESTVVKVLTSLNSSMVISSLNLNAGKLAANLTTVMKKAIITAQDLQSTQNFEQFLNFTNPAPCDYFFYRMGMLQLDIELYQIVVYKIQENVTRLYSDSRDIYWYYQVNYKPLKLSWTRDLTVFTVFKNLWSTIKEYTDFSALVRANIVYMDKLYAYLQQNLPTAICPPFNSTTKTLGDPIEADLVLAESELIGLENVALQKIRTALQTVTSTARSTSDSPTRAQLISLENILEKTITKNDYPKLRWPRIPDATNKGDNGFYGKMQSFKVKAKKYRFVDSILVKNQTMIQIIYDALSKTVASSSRKVRAASPAVNDVLIATKAVLYKYANYLLRIRNALIRINQIVAPNTALCSRVSNMTNSKGNYVKSACLVKTNLNFDAAQTACQVNNMPSLYAVATADDYSGIRSFANAASLPLPIGKKYAISGGSRPSDYRWFNRNVLMTPVYKSIINEYCLFIKGVGGVSKFYAYPCANQLAKGICEYDKNSQSGLACSSSWDIKSSSNVYIKTACVLPISSDSYTNHQTCKTSGKSGLYTITNADDAQGIKNYIIYLNAVSGTYSIAGWFLDGPWYYLDKQNFWLGKPDLQDLACQCIEGFATGFYASVYSCSDVNYYICEFKYEIL